MKTLKEWRIERGLAGTAEGIAYFRSHYPKAEMKGLADPGVADPGTPKTSGKVLPDRRKIPDISTFTFDRDRERGPKVVEDLKPLGDISPEEISTKSFRNKGTYYKYQTPGIPKYSYDVNKIAATRLDPG